MTHRVTTAALNGAVFSLMLGVGWIVPILPVRVLELSGSLCQVGWLASCFAISYLLFQLPLGVLSDRIGMKVLLVLGYLLCAVSGLLFSTADTTGTLFLARFIQGIGEVPIWSTGPALLSLLYPLSKGKQAGIYNGSLHVGLTVGTLSGILLNAHLSQHAMFFMFSGSTTVSALLVLFFVESPKQKSRDSMSKTTWREAIEYLKSKHLLRLYLSIAAYGVGYGVFITLIPGRMAQLEINVSGFFALFYLGIGTAQIVASLLSDSPKRALGLSAGLMASGIGFLLFIQASGIWMLALLTIAAIGLGIFCVCAFAQLSDAVPQSLKGTASGVFFACWGMGYFFGPIVLGALADKGYFHGGFMGLGLLLILLAQWHLLPGARLRAEI